MIDERTAYSDSLYCSEQLSYIKFFDPSYGLFYMIFFKDLNTIPKLLLIKKKVKLLCAPSRVHTAGPPEADSGLR